MAIPDLQLMRLHADTLFIHDSSGHLLYVNEPVDPELHPAPLVFIGRTWQGAVCRYRRELPEGIRFQVRDILKRFDARDLTEHQGLLSELHDVVGAYADVGDTWTGPAYRFPDILAEVGECVLVCRSNRELLNDGFQDIVPELESPHVQPCVAQVVDGRAVSICRSVRRSAYADEAGVETLPEYRRRSFGARVVARWASLVRKAGRIPLYSTSWSNTASRGLAARLGLILYGADLHISERAPSQPLGYPPAGAASGVE